uniref:carotenoid oxygenase family protein n=1 Tax=uncultured Caulobacter sp. TaxID=158749 RepID=UPI0025FA347B|nr:carotenoid oxygenase family protein [uncultured Caulobacter sp.]
MDGDVRINPFLSGNFAPVRSEDDFVLEIWGQLPPGLRGTLYRNGPNPQFDPRDANYHWFVGDGMLHAFTVADGQVRYRNRWVRTNKWSLEHEAGQALFGSWGNPMTTDPSVLGVVSEGAANTNIIQHGGHLLALEEAHAPFEMSGPDLETLGTYDLGGKVTAHPKTCAFTGQLVFFAYADDPMPLSNKISWGLADKDGRLLKRETFEAPYCSMIHDAIVTERHIVIPVLPLTGSLPRAMGGKPAFAWEPEVGGHLAVIRRDQGVASLRWIEIPACYVFHVMNAFEEGETIVADVMRYDTAPLFPNPDGTKGENAAAYLTRWTIDLEAGTVAEAALDDTAGEFPRFDERFAGMPYRHGWFVGQSLKPGDFRSNIVVHLDLATGAKKTWTAPQGDAISEVVFTHAGPDAAEGEGWLTAVIYRQADDVSEFVVFDAQKVEQGPIAGARLPRRVPFGFHGQWVAA